MLTEAIVLAGGFGTRLKEVIADKPKPMAEINGKPFLEYLLIYLEKNGISRVILSVGFKAEQISGYFGNHFRSIELVYAIEHEPLGTGGGILNSLQHSKSDTILILNGDTLFNIDIQQFFNFHISKKAELSVALRKMDDGSRYGSIAINTKNRITEFLEKQANSENVLINGGTYILSKKSFLKNSFPQRFSFEKEYLETMFDNQKFYGKVVNDYFIDIGIPSAYEKAQSDLLKIF